MSAPSSIPTHIQTTAPVELDFAIRYINGYLEAAKPQPDLSPEAPPEGEARIGADSRGRVMTLVERIRENAQVDALPSMECGGRHGDLGQPVENKDAIHESNKITSPRKSSIKRKRSEAATLLEEASRLSIPKEDNSKPLAEPGLKPSPPESHTIELTIANDIRSQPVNAERIQPPEDSLRTPPMDQLGNRQSKKRRRARATQGADEPNHEPKPRQRHERRQLKKWKRELKQDRDHKLGTPAKCVPADRNGSGRTQEERLALHNAIRAKKKEKRKQKKAAKRAKMKSKTERPEEYKENLSATDKPAVSQLLLPERRRAVAVVIHSASRKHVSLRAGPSPWGEDVPKAVKQATPPPSPRGPTSQPPSLESREALPGTPAYAPLSPSQPPHDASGLFDSLLRELSKSAESIPPAQPVVSEEPPSPSPADRRKVRVHFSGLEDTPVASQRELRSGTPRARKAKKKRAVSLPSLEDSVLPSSGVPKTPEECVERVSMMKSQKQELSSHPASEADTEKQALADATGPQPLTRSPSTPSKRSATQDVPTQKPSPGSRFGITPFQELGMDQPATQEDLVGQFLGPEGTLSLW
ncbi:hypothetical protein EJ06DRAFT_552541 [Trichodelitschia bisporula]|uniref:Uncharacterized protein n=1 Tax=Trichodelitschia bisporula TaxID=703511 RepID=A0A6G1IAK4_9PEZI|nr:hypothetical protein EJ06DRAFT_552541 [Trichodelitschia bisporula]